MSIKYTCVAFSLILLVAFASSFPETQYLSFTCDSRIITRNFVKMRAPHSPIVITNKSDFSVLVPIGTDIELSFSNPPGIEPNDTLDFKFMLNVEFLQTDPECKEFMTSFRIEPVLTS